VGAPVQCSRGNGRILIDGEDVTDYDEEALNRVRQRIGIHFQDGALFDCLSVYDNMAFRCHERGVPEEIVEQEVRRLLRFVDLEDAIDMMLHNFQAVCAFASALRVRLRANPELYSWTSQLAG